MAKKSKCPKCNSTKKKPGEHPHIKFDVCQECGQHYNVVHPS